MFEVLRQCHPHNSKLFSRCILPGEVFICSNYGGLQKRHADIQNTAAKTVQVPLALSEQTKPSKNLSTRANFRIKCEERSEHMLLFFFFN